ncbi:MAG: hypothetical protein AB9869_10510 [Verrucomicrobiia bacterium]
MELRADVRRTRIEVWLNPVPVCRVRFTERTRDGHPRHPLFVELRDDKRSREIARGPGAGPKSPN